MEFAKYYNVTKLVDDMQKKEEIDTYPIEERINLLVYMFALTQMIFGFQELVKT